ncbi:MAG: DEAD/DEAH box helicase family protein [Bacteroidales bacterium]|nr:DEAD/DEAH box helicase family protein [Bacteroidales bacterium]
MLKEVSYPPHRRYKSRTQWEPVGFFSECLCNATQFDLMLGFFSSSAINVLADGFASFLYNGGRMRLIINDILTEQDKVAFANGTLDTLPFFDLTDLEKLKSTLSEHDTHFFECLSWLIKNDRLEVKIVAPKEGIGISHTKTGVFGDGEDYVVFDGSCNFSRTALIDNIESLTVSCEWDGSIEAEKAKDIKDDFEIVFNGKDETVVYMTTDQVRTQLVDSFRDKSLTTLLEDEYKLIERNAKEKDLPSSVKCALEKAKQRVSAAINKLKEEKIEDGEGVITQTIEPCFPYSTGPRDYQKQAFENWKSNNQKGLFAMATGTGKTITSLNCLLEIYKRNGYYKAIILVPTITLVNQWEQECEKFHFSNVIKVYSKNSEWRSRIERLQMAEEYKKTKESSQNYIIISTYASFTRGNVFDILNGFEKSKVLLIADEAHNMGSPMIMKRIGDIKYLRRIGLSATPERQFDDDTNRKLFRFFGAEKQYTYEYSMEEAIENGVLCRYFYYPHLVRLTDDEFQRYVELSLKISKYFNFNTNSFDKKDDILMSMLLARKRIVHKAANKLMAFNQIINERYQKKGNLKYSLVYVPEGTKPDYIADSDIFDSTDQVADDIVSDHLIDEYTEAVMKLDKFITVKKFVSGQKDRDKVLSDFASGKLQVLTSMKCLDEGVDVPRSELAIFCASTGNPRQFIQRRGRILRKHKDKFMAEIHDLVVAPEVNPGSDSFRMERALLKGELMRVKNFSLLSENPSFSQLELKSVMEHYGLNMYNNDHIV